MTIRETPPVTRARVSRTIAAAAKKLLPKPMVAELQRVRSYSDTERSIYLRLRIRDSLAYAKPHMPKTARSFLFVCYGNIMRSPMCEALMNRELARLGNGSYRATSAGLNATPGRAAHPWAIDAAREFGISLEHHRARLLTREMLDQADVIFAMDYQNRVQLESRWSPLRAKILMLSAFADNGNRCAEISDPYHADEEQTRLCYRLLETCVKNLLAD